jgi:DNA polymerase III subunit epsilon
VLHGVGAGRDLRGLLRNRELDLPLARAVIDLLARPSFVAIDFETADQGRDSACAVGLVRVEGDRITDRLTRLIRPPRPYFIFTYIHGLTWADVADQPTFGGHWPELARFVDGADFLVAHNAPFDRAVLQAGCEGAGLPPPPMPFECTVRWARRTWGLHPANLPAVCRHLGIDLRHHDASSDSEACARIMIAVREEWRGREADVP